MRHLLAAAAFLVAAGPAFAQGASPNATAPTDPAQSKAVDDGYRTACSAAAPKELCECLIGVGGAQVPDPGERQIFYAYTTGEVEKARTARASFDPEKNMKFNVTLQRAEAAVHQQCDALRPAKPAQPAQPGAAPTGQPQPQ